MNWCVQPEDRIDCGFHVHWDLAVRVNCSVAQSNNRNWLPFKLFGVCELVFCVAVCSTMCNKCFSISSECFFFFRASLLFEILLLQFSFGILNTFFLFSLSSILRYCAMNAGQFDVQNAVNHLVLSIIKKIPEEMAFVSQKQLKNGIEWQVSDFQRIKSDHFIAQIRSILDFYVDFIHLKDQTTLWTAIYLAFSLPTQAILHSIKLSCLC